MTREKKGAHANLIATLKYFTAQIKMKFQQKILLTEENNNLDSTKIGRFLKYLLWQNDASMCKVFVEIIMIML